MCFKMLPVVLFSVLCINIINAEWQDDVVVEGVNTKVIAHVHDRQDRPHILFFDDNSSCLYYTFWDDDSWETVTIDSGIQCYECSLVLDWEDRPHISWHDKTHQMLEYTVYKDGIWHNEIVDDEDGAGYYSALAVDYRNRPGIAYSKDENPILKYAFKPDDVWMVEVVDGVSDSGTDCNLVFDNNGYACICYRKDYDDFYFARQNASGWDIQLIDGHNNSSGYWFYDYGKENSMSIDRMGNPHIACLNSSTYFEWIGLIPYIWKSYCLKYYNLDGGTWHEETLSLDSEHYYPFYSSLSVDNLGRPHVVYECRDLNYLYKENNEWISENLGKGSVARRSLSVNSSSCPSIVYLSEERDLRLLWERSPVWYDLWLHDRSLQAGDNFVLDRRIKNRSGQPISVIEYLALEISGAFYFWPDWTHDVKDRELSLENGEYTGETILEFNWPEGVGTIRGAGFWGALVDAGAFDTLTIDFVEWQSLE